MSAELLFYEKYTTKAEAIVEMCVWKVPQSERYPFGVRYSLFCVKDREVIVGYDNHFPKGPHKHYGSREEEYEFLNVDHLIENFLKDVKRFLP